MSHLNDLRPALYKVKSTNEFATLDIYWTKKMYWKNPLQFVVNQWHSYNDSYYSSRAAMPSSDLTEIKTYGDIISMFEAPETVPHLELKVQAMGDRYGDQYGGMAVTLKNRAENARSSDVRHSDGVLFRIYEPLDPDATPLKQAELVRFTEPRNDSSDFNYYQDIPGFTLLPETRATHELILGHGYEYIAAPSELLNPESVGDECARKAQKLALTQLARTLRNDLGFFELCYDFDMNKYGRVHSRRRHQIGHAYARGILPQAMGINTQTVDDLVMRMHNLRSDAFVDLG